MEAPMTHEVLRQRYLALEAATASRLSVLNTRIKEERKQRNPCQEKIDYLKGKRKEIFEQLNLIREALRMESLTELSYKHVQDAYLNFVANW